MSLPSKRAADEMRLEACIRDLVALAMLPAWWIGLYPQEIAENLRDVLTSMLRADGVRVQLFDPESGQPRVVASGENAGDGDEDDDGSMLRRASFPMGLDDRIGRFEVVSLRPEFPTDLERLLMQVAASQVTTALQYAELLARHTRAETHLRSRASQQAVVARLGLDAVTGLSPEHLLAEAVIAVREALRADFCEILELSDDRRWLLLRAATGWPAELAGESRLSIEAASQAAFALASREPVVVRDFRSETRFDPSPLLREHDVRSGVSVIIHTPRAPFGVLGVHSREAREFAGDDVNFLQSVANLLAAALERHRAEAEREQLHASTAAAKAEAERASRVKSEFLGIISHELRTPLNAIGGYAQLIEDGIHGPVTDAQRTALGRIRRSQSYLLSLINNVLSYLKLGAGMMAYELTEFQVMQVLANAEELIRPQLEAKQLRYEQRCSDAAICVRADFGKVQQIILNLLSNATKFTDVGGSVRLDCATTESNVRIRVEDTGCGIPPGELESVFEAFVRVQDRRGATVEGTGLGLAISRDLARGMSGELSVESELGKGSAFTLRLPRAG